MPAFFILLFCHYLLAATVTGQRREQKENSRHVR